jgi:hypothetical protein
MVLTPPSQLGEELWTLRRRLRQDRVVAIRPKTLRLALVHPMPEDRSRGRLRSAGHNVATTHDLRRQYLTSGLAVEWQAPEPGRDERLSRERTDWMEGPRGSGTE